MVWQIGCALAQNIETLIVCRLFAGIGGSGCLTLGAGVIADLFPTEQRGMATAIWAMGPLVGPVVGPIAGGFLGEEAGWRWVFWLLLIAGGAMALGMELLNEETYAAVLIRWKTEKMAKETGRSDLRSAYETGKEPASPKKILAQGLMRPLLLFYKSPIVLLLSLYMVSSTTNVFVASKDNPRSVHPLTDFSLLFTVSFIFSLPQSPRFSQVSTASPWVFQDSPIWALDLDSWLDLLLLL